MLTIREANIDDLPEMLDIYNDAILHLTATFDMEEQSIGERRKWFEQHGGRNPLIVAQKDGAVAGYASLSPFRDKEAYKDTTEISIYISKDYRGFGIGKTLMEEILRLAAELNYHVIIAGITTGNEGSVRLHEKYGFEFIGRFKEVGFKFGEWQSVDFYQLTIS